MCWAACDRLARIAARLGIAERRAYWKSHADAIRGEVLERAWNPRLNSFVQSFGSREIDASLLLMPELGVVQADDPRFLGTLALIEKHLRSGKYLFRRSEEHTSELQSLMRISYAVFCLKKKKTQTHTQLNHTEQK